MKNAKTTRRALLSSVVALVLCLTMLMGTTFAWFTDTASVKVNTITSGTLEIALVDADGNPLPEKLEFIKAADAAEGEKLLWEPGCTYELPAVYIKNMGNLAIKYEVVVTGIEGDAELLDVIEWTVDYGYGDATEGHLAVGDTLSAPITIKGHMKEEANNDYQDKTLEGIAINVYATQDTVEYDSTTNQYDKNATVDKYVKLPEGTTQEDVNNAITGTNEPTVVELPKGEYTLPTVSNKELTISGDKDTVIDMTSNIGSTGADLTFDGVTVNFDNDNYEGFQHSEKVVYENCVINGKQFLYSDTEFINCTFVNTADYCVWTYGAANVTFTGCTFTTGGKAILVYNEQLNYTGNITLTDCVFNDDNSLNTVKAAVETGIVSGSNNVYNITFTNCTVNGFAINDEGISTGSTFWGNKNSMDADHLIVTVK